MLFGGFRLRRAGMLAGGHCFRRRLDDRAEEMVKVVLAAERARDAGPSTDDGEHGEQHERREHDGGTLMRRVACVRIGMAVLVFCPAAVLAEEGEEPPPEHVEGR